MIKNLLLSAAVATMGIAASASTVDVWTGSQSFSSWGDNIYVEATNFTALAEGDQIVLTLTDVNTVMSDQEWSTINLKTNATNWPELNGCETWVNLTTGDTSHAWTLNATAVSEVKETGLIVQGLNFTVTKISYISAADVDPNLLFEGEATIISWNSAGNVASSKVKAGDILKYTFSEPGSESGQVLVKNDSWANLLGTGKINYADLAKGVVEVGVTPEMIENCGSQIFLQGDGGCVLTKVELVPDAFDATNYIAYGDRACGTSIFCTLAEGTTQLELVLESTPTWIQICNSDWGSLVDNNDATTTTNSDGTVSMVFPISSDAIEAINAKSEMVLNSDASTVVKAVKYVSDSTNTISAIAEENNAPVEYYNLQGIRVADPANGIYIRRQGNTATKVYVK